MRKESIFQPVSPVFITGNKTEKSKGLKTGQAAGAFVHEILILWLNEKKKYMKTKKFLNEFFKIFEMIFILISNTFVFFKSPFA